MATKSTNTRSRTTKTKKTETKQQAEKTPSQKCTMCGEVKPITQKNFYKSFSILFKNNYEQRMCVCKDCVLKLYDYKYEQFGTHLKALYETCRQLDIYFNKKLYESLLEIHKDKKDNGVEYEIVAQYITKINSLPHYRGRTFMDSDVIEDSEVITELEAEEEVDVVDFWGEGYKKEDYEFLQREYDNLLKDYECDSYAQVVMFKNIAFQQLTIKKKRLKGGSVKDELKLLQDLFGTANIKPSQENASMNDNQLSFGTLIKKWENEKPIPEPEKDWKSKDWIRKYVVVWFLGNLCKMMGKPIPYEEEYKEEMEKYTVKPPTDEEGDF